MRAAIVGIAGPSVLPAERALLGALPPAGVILFRRNIEDPPQLRALTRSLRDALPPGAVIAVDQEGGRVARLRPPHWRDHPPAATIARSGTRAAYLTGVLIGLDCAASGLDMACAPVLDLRVADASDVIGDRSYGDDQALVAACGLAMADGLMAAGVMPVAKHAPGHGRALVDSHHELPSVPAATDLTDDIAVFQACAGLPWMMTAHLLYCGIDAERPGTLSPTVIGRVIRERIGFEGVLVSDDLAMRALDGAPGDLAAAALAAGCDLALHCTGVLGDSEAVLRAAEPVGARTQARLRAARATLSSRTIALDGHALAAERDRLLAC